MIPNLSTRTPTANNASACVAAKAVAQASSCPAVQGAVYQLIALVPFSGLVLSAHRRVILQSKEYQKKHWRNGHKLQCMGYKLFRDRSIQPSRNPDAWSELMQWAEFHHSSIINATLACYIHKKDAVPDVTSKYLLQPVEKKFEMRGARTSTPRTTPRPPSCTRWSSTDAPRPYVAMGKREMGNSLYWPLGHWRIPPHGTLPPAPARVRHGRDPVLEALRYRQDPCKRATGVPQPARPARGEPDGRAEDEVLLWETRRPSYMLLQRLDP